MATKTPLKYEANEHTPFEAGDTIDGGIVVFNPGDINGGSIAPGTYAVASDNTIDGDGKTATPLSIGLSEDTGNLLEKRANGLFFAPVAPPSLINLFVDAVGGNNANLGTQAAPLQTIEEALNRHNNASVNYYINLKAGQTHHKTTVGPNRALANLSFFWYDDPLYDDFYASNGLCGLSYRSNSANNLNRPVIAIHYLENTDLGIQEAARFIYETLNIYGCRIQYVIDNPVSALPVRSANIFDGKLLYMNGCIIDLSTQRPDSPLVFYSHNVTFARCNIVYVAGEEVDAFSPGRIIPDITSTDADTSASSGVCSGYPAYTGLVNNVTVAFNAPNCFSGLVYDVPTKKTFNMNIGWDIFD